jgi:hypothetical protein
MHGRGVRVRRDHASWVIASRTLAVSLELLEANDPSTTYDEVVRTRTAIWSPVASLTGATAGAPLTLRNGIDDGSQDWELVQ